MAEKALKKFETILLNIFTLPPKNAKFRIPEDPIGIDLKTSQPDIILRNMVNAFLIVLSGKEHPLFAEAFDYLNKMNRQTPWREFSDFLLQGIEIIQNEIRFTAEQDADFLHRLNTLFEWLRNFGDLNDIRLTAEKIRTLFFPEGAGILENINKTEEELRKKRTIRVQKSNAAPIADPARQILFTSNVLLTVPLPGSDIESLQVGEGIKQTLRINKQQPQKHWYDHPIPVGVNSASNEVLYGLRGLNEMMEFEKRRGNTAADQKLTCVLSCSVTHPYLHSVAKPYLRETITQNDGFDNLKVFLFTEDDTQKIVNQVLIPACRKFLPPEFHECTFDVFGVDGEYGRHYSFLKAVSAFWSVFIDTEIKATFKIDLDQVFPQKELVNQTGSSALEHLKSQLWGADGIDAQNAAVHLGMIAGALVNARDIERSLFTPDVPYPGDPREPDEFIFFSRLPQALSTVAEMMTRYDSEELDGKSRCLQRIHVTGGVNGILIDALRRFRPFTPSFFGRAEDQAYLLSTMIRSGEKLAYLHKPGLIMRHDKEIFAGDSIKASEIGRIIGDYVRILYFSAYARALDKDYKNIKERVDPFTGCFISAIPKTVVYLRFTLKLLSFLQKGDSKPLNEFLGIGIPKIKAALNFTDGEHSILENRFLEEQRQWNVYYEVLNAAEKAIQNNDAFALTLKKKAAEICHGCKIG